MRKRIYIAAGLVVGLMVVTAGLAVLVSLHRAEMARERAIQIQQFAGRLLAERAAPAHAPDFQLCLIGSPGCEKLDSRPFALCPAADDSCGRTAQLQLLESIDRGRKRMLPP